MISIVDDDASVREATKELVRSLGYSAAAFASAEDFLQSGQLSETACLISDVQMPGLSGIDLQRRLLDGGHNLPIIFITAFPDERARARALGAGAIGFLTKPYREESLIECLGQALKS
jgi:FixJ family two-component response regulator